MLQLNNPQRFSLELTDHGGYVLTTGGSRCTFTAPSSIRGIAKLYTVSHAKTMLYVGIAEQPMSSRLTYGFRAKGKGGYYGYKWKLLRDPLRLTVWTAQAGDRAATLRELETVEAEVAFLCRLRSEQWPTYQHEIHFYPSQEWHRQAAERIYEFAISEA